MPNTDKQTRLVTIARESTWFWPALVAVRSLKLPSWCIGAGAIRNLVWDSLHDYKIPSALSDIDVSRFDASDLSAKSDAEIQRRLSSAYPYVPWEVTEQARGAYVVRSGLWSFDFAAGFSGKRCRIVA